ncbi:unnamed protein product [Allacma fusca]|uniref:Uncharacterized protein n=1 Tax=Allacma fusca TaxID=39272 RepID=A0A8J2LHA2_9HEXA|nr:unnamed protein product [Allacma fusca]
MTLSNYLDSALTDPQYHFYQGSRKSGPTRVVENFSEVFYFSGEDRCQFLCSFAIRKTLRLTICCLNYSDGTILFGIGFTPADVPTDQSLFRALYSMPPATDVWMTKPYSKTPVELFVTRRNLLVRDGSISRSVGKIARFSCNVEIANFLNVPLRNGNKFYSNSKDKDFWPLEIQSFQRETIFGSSDTNLKAMFSYEIVSTDLALVIALKVGPGSNSFAAAFSQIPAFTEKKDLKALMNPSEWKIHDYKKCSDASKTVEVIRDRNIRAEILMTEEENSILKIHIYVV